MEALAAGQFGDTTYSKLFVRGLAWETQKDTMKKYFEQFGEILEAVVITDTITGKSKGYGFVTFRETDAAVSSDHRCSSGDRWSEGELQSCIF